jgi:hypothetical protein
MCLHVLYFLYILVVIIVLSAWSAVALDYLVITCGRLVRNQFIDPPTCSNCL